jgi:hypothetical protein
MQCDIYTRVILVAYTSLPVLANYNDDLDITSYSLLLKFESTI